MSEQEDTEIRLEARLLMFLIGTLHSENSLEEISLEDAQEEFLEDIREEKSYATFRKHRSVMRLFRDYVNECDDDLSVLTELQRHHLKGFKKYLRNRGNQKISLNGALSNFRVFIGWCADSGYVHDELYDKVPVPDTSKDEEVRADPPSDERVAQTHEYYDKHEYASRRHAEFELMREIGFRLGTIRGLDEEDHNYEEAYLDLQHRPEGDDVKGTPLKNGDDSEREVNISDYLNQLLRDYQKNDPVRQQHGEVIDKFGRRPLFTTATQAGETGRPSTTTIRRDIYKMMRPCVVGEDCPEGRDPSECEATMSSYASECPATSSPHPLRTWSIMYQLDQGVDKELLSDRVDVSVPVLEDHYDQREEERKRTQRRGELVGKLPGYEMQMEDQQSEQTTTEDQPDSPIAHVTQHINPPEPIAWLHEDVRNAVSNPKSAPTPVVALLGSYGVTIIAVQLGPLVL